MGFGTVASNLDRASGTGTGGTTATGTVNITVIDNDDPPATALVSNTGRPVSDNQLNARVAIKFTTGSNTRGYKLATVGVRLGQTVSGSITVTIRESSGTDPGTLVAGLTDPNSFPSDTVDSFTAASNTVLAANTGYSLTWPSATISN